MKQDIGKIMALDVGDARVGVAFSDPSGFLASPGEILKRDGETIHKIVELVKTHTVRMILVGLPLNMDGSLGFQAKKVQRFAKQVGVAAGGIPIEMEDERESTIMARELRFERGTKQKKRRSRVDAEAAAIFLQAYLDRVRDENSKS